MENVKLIFSGTKDSSTEFQQLEAYATDSNEIYISITESDCNHDHDIQPIFLNKQSAVRLVRELKKQIGYIKESEGVDGK